MKLFEINGKLIKDAVLATKDLFLKVPILLTPDKLVIMDMDPSHVSYLRVVIQKDQFIEYNLEEHDEHELMLDVDKMKILFSKVKTGDIVSFDLENNQLTITIKGKRNISTTLGLLDETAWNRIIPNETECKVVIDSAEVVDSLKTLNEIEKDVDVTIEISEDKISFSGRNVTSKTRLEIKKDAEDKIFEFETGGETTKAAYNLMFLLDILKGIPSKTVKLEMIPNGPIFLTATGDLDMVYLLAPRQTDE